MTLLIPLLNLVTEYLYSYTDSSRSLLGRIVLHPAPCLHVLRRRARPAMQPCTPACPRALRV